MKFLTVKDIFRRNDQENYWDMKLSVVCKSEESKTFYNA